MQGFLVTGLAMLLFIGNVNLTLSAVILLAPISVPIELTQFDMKMSFPTEFATMILAIMLTIKLVYYERFNWKIVKHPVAIILILDLLWTFVSSAYSSETSVSFKRLMLEIMFVGVYFFAIAHWFNDKGKKRHLFILYGLGLLYPIWHTLDQHWVHDFSQVVSFAMCQPYFSDHTIYGACIAFVLPFFMIYSFDNQTNNKWLYYSITIILFIALLFSYSRASWICVLVSLMMLLLIKVKIQIKHLAIVLGLFSLFIYQNFDQYYHQIKTQETVENDDNVANHLGSVANLNTDASNLERINRWVAAYNMFIDKPITGFGPGTYQFEYASYQDLEFKTAISTNEGNRGHAHSEYFGALAETGVFGFLFFTGFIILILHYGLKVYYATNDKLVLAAFLGILSFAIQGLFNGFMDYEKMAILVYGSAAIIVLADLQLKKDVQSEI